MGGRGEGVGGGWADRGERDGVRGAAAAGAARGGVPAHPDCCRRGRRAQGPRRGAVPRGARREPPRAGGARRSHGEGRGRVRSPGGAGDRPAVAACARGRCPGGDRRADCLDEKGRAGDRRRGHVPGRPSPPRGGGARGPDPGGDEARAGRRGVGPARCPGPREGRRGRRDAVRGGRLAARPGGGRSTGGDAAGGVRLRRGTGEGGAGGVCDGRGRAASGARGGRSREGGRPDAIEGARSRPRARGPRRRHPTPPSGARRSRAGRDVAARAGCHARREVRVRPLDGGGRGARAARGPARSPPSRCGWGRGHADGGPRRGDARRRRGLDGPAAPRLGGARGPGRRGGALARARRRRHPRRAGRRDPRTRGGRHGSAGAARDLRREGKLPLDAPTTDGRTPYLEALAHGRVAAAKFLVEHGAQAETPRTTADAGRRISPLEATRSRRDLAARRGRASRRGATTDRPCCTRPPPAPPRRRDPSCRGALPRRRSTATGGRCSTSRRGPACRGRSPPPCGLGTDGLHGARRRHAPPRGGGRRAREPRDRAASERVDPVGQLDDSDFTLLHYAAQEGAPASCGSYSTRGPRSTHGAAGAAPRRFRWPRASGGATPWRCCSNGARASPCPRRTARPCSTSVTRGGLADPVEDVLEAGIPCKTRRTQAGRTPLHDAAASGHLEVVEALLAAGAPVDPWIRDGGVLSACGC